MSIRPTPSAPKVDESEEDLVDLPREIHWSVQLEKLIAREAEKSRGLAWIHQRAEANQNYRDNMIQIPGIVLSTIAGTASVGSSSLFGQYATYAIIGIGGVSIFVGILNTLGNYFKFAKRAEAHRIAYIQYSKLFSQISIELALPRNERMAPPNLLKLLRDSMERLSETTPSPPTEIINQFNKEFHDVEDIAMPSETNGLEKVNIYSHREEVEAESAQNSVNRASELRVQIKDILNVDI
jgi:hypothetical protein